MFGNVDELDILNGLLKDLLRYCYEYGCGVDQAIGDYDQPLSFLGADLEIIRDAAIEILDQCEEEAFMARL